MKEDHQKITHHIKLFAKHDKSDELFNALNECANEAIKTNGCEYHEVLQNIANPLLFTVVVKYSNYDAFKEHLKKPILRNFIDNLQSQLIDKVSDHLYVTRINSLGEIKNINVVDLPYRGEIKK